MSWATEALISLAAAVYLIDQFFVPMIKAFIRERTK